jgi:hypothetical protein
MADIRDWKTKTIDCYEKGANGLPFVCVRFGRAAARYESALRATQEMATSRLEERLDDT